MSFNSYIDFKIKESLRILRFIHIISLVVLFIFAIVIYWLVSNSGNSGTDDYLPSLIVLVVTSLALVSVSLFISNLLIARINKTKSSETILKTYRAIYIFKYITLILPVFAGYLGYLYHSNLKFFLVSLGLIIIMIAQKPTKRNLNKVIRA